MNYLAMAVIYQLEFLDDIIDGSTYGHGTDHEDALTEAQCQIELIKAGVEKLGEVKEGGAK